ncbi:hypothetical protein ANO14919_142680 [Xylariales sp. No.14919]|nr:hypothetical protein ANO14919_142680 [Xylariales sp. No.14919]
MGRDLSGDMTLGFAGRDVSLYGSCTAAPDGALRGGPLWGLWGLWGQLKPAREGSVRITA